LKSMMSQDNQANNETQAAYQVGDIIGDRFKVYHVYAGGFGQVYLCLSAISQEPYALKTFLPKYLVDRKVRQAFEDEVALWVSLEKHANLVHCFSLDILDNIPFIVMEWVPGIGGAGATDLHSLIEAGPPSVQQALDFVIDICQGLIHARKKQPDIVHRDLKPENILVTPQYVAKITDFGLAQLAQQADKKANQLGTYYYWSPEQWTGEKLDVRTDIYSLGCILYELLTGNLPYQAETIRGLRKLHHGASIPQLGKDVELADALNPVIQACLAKRKEERPASVNILLEKLMQVYQQNFGITPRVLPTTEQGMTVDNYIDRMRTYRVTQQYDLALRDFDRAIQDLGPGLSDKWLAVLYTNRGNVFRSMKQPDAAMADFDRAIELYPAEVIPYINKAALFYDTHRFKEVIVLLQVILEQWPYIGQRELVVAYEYLGLAYMGLDDYQTAKQHFTRAIEINPKYALAYYNRGVVCDHLKQFDEALVDYAHARTLDTDLNVFAHIHNNKGMAHYDSGCNEAALDEFNEAIQIDSTFSSAYFNRGNTYERLRQYEKAEQDYTAAVLHDPANFDAYINRAALYHDLQRFDEAISDYTRILEIVPNYVRALSSRSNTYTSLEQYDKALEDQNLAIQIDPTYGPAYYNRGLTYDILGDKDQALANYRRAFEFKPDFVDAYVNAGIILFQIKRDYRAALECFEKATALGDTASAENAAQLRRFLGE